ncbi:ABC transporter substrate-binding protein [Rhizobium sp. SSA_523]|uniref:ABC transporter substrate-binding protein n=1 Tax=Rhizobium sp. SSA_523 TaxID=2952477 RepID=UPI002090F7C1|nr:substrate-binding domain-containing protein [Rhizobium sp. SSA_523]MCO5731603.1 substrate-binding domain-containing protein [Rhizobium sp. SSA_523]WKC21884.1 substrate-binding domain-containing protein [Rhizobium sp. SSA_523]
MMARTLLAASVALCLSLTGWIFPVAVLAQDRTVRLAGVLSETRIAPLLAALAAQLPGADLTYIRLSSAQIAAEAKRAQAPFDIAVFSSPDIAVSVANEGYAAKVEAGANAVDAQWRHEVFGFWSDPAVMVLRRAAFADRLPRTRIELVRALEQDSERFSRRVGVVNIGIDDVSYLLASQDSIRTSLYWRLMRAFGGANARIYDTTDDLLEALREGELDALYNVPLSALQAGAAIPEGMEIVVPQDYVLAVPWTVLVPKTATNLRGARLIRHALHSEGIRPALASAGFSYPADFKVAESLQRIELGPELLVFRDMIKRSKFLDIWFQMIVN